MNPWVLLGGFVLAVSIAVGGYAFGVSTTTDHFEAEHARLLDLARENTIFIQGQDRVLVKEVIRHRQQVDDGAQAVRERITNAKPAVVWTIPADDARLWNDALCAGFVGTGSSRADGAATPASPAPPGGSDPRAGAAEPGDQCGGSKQAAGSGKRAH